MQRFCSMAVTTLSAIALTIFAKPVSTSSYPTSIVYPQQSQEMKKADFDKLVKSLVELGTLGER